VIARSTAFTYKGKPVDVKQVGSALTLCGAVPNRSLGPLRDSFKRH
jgi:hypothetical protein